MINVHVYHCLHCCNSFMEHLTLKQKASEMLSEAVFLLIKLCISYKKNRVLKECVNTLKSTGFLRHECPIMHCTKEIEELFTASVQLIFIVGGCGTIKEGNKKFFVKKKYSIKRSRLQVFVY